MDAHGQAGEDTTLISLPGKMTTLSVLNYTVPSQPRLPTSEDAESGTFTVAVCFLSTNNSTVLVVADGGFLQRPVLEGLLPQHAPGERRYLICPPSGHRDRDSAQLLYRALKEAAML